VEGEAEADEVAVGMAAPPARRGGRVRRGAAGAGVARGRESLLGDAVRPRAARRPVARRRREVEHEKTAKPHTRDL
jgi:hypothetical protein